MKRAMVVWVLVAMIALPIIARAAGGRHEPLAGVALTGEQRGRLQHLRKDLDVRSAEAAKKLEAAETALEGLWRAETPDRDAILAQMQQLDRAASELRTARVDHRLAVLQVLTPEQRSELRERPAQARADGPGADRLPALE